MIALLYPEVRGNGYLAINDILHSHYEIHLLLALLIAKLLATVITVGSGAVGGVFTPTLFLGAALGSFWGMVLNHYNLGPTNLSMARGKDRQRSQRENHSTDGSSNPHH